VWGHKKLEGLSGQYSLLLNGDDYYDHDYYRYYYDQYCCYYRHRDCCRYCGDKYRKELWGVGEEDGS
jgi:hypothetical protein